MVQARNSCRSAIRADRVLSGVFRPTIAVEKLLSLAMPPFPRTGIVIETHLLWNPNPIRTALNLYSRIMAKPPLHPHIINLANA